MPDNARFTAWFSESERRALEQAAKEQGASINFILRTIVRAWIREQSLQLSHVTTEEE